MSPAGKLTRGKNVVTYSLVGKCYLFDKVVFASVECCLPTLPFLVVLGVSTQQPVDLRSVLQGLSPRHHVEFESRLRNWIELNELI